MTRPPHTLIILCAVIAALFSQANLSYSQSFTITSIGELDFDSDQIVVDGVVSKYFGMFVEGSGESVIRVTVGQKTFDKSYEFRSSPTQLFSFLFNSELAEEVSIAFRRGVVGDVKIDLIDSLGAVSTSATFALDVTLPKNNCRKYQSSRVKKCKRLNLANAKPKQQRKLAKVFAQSIRSPIVLEP